MKKLHRLGISCPRHNNLYFSIFKNIKPLAVHHCCTIHLESDKVGKRDDKLSHEDSQLLGLQVAVHESSILCYCRLGVF